MDELNRENTNETKASETNTTETNTSETNTSETNTMETNTTETNENKKPENTPNERDNNYCRNTGANDNYVFWAEEAAAKQPQYEAATYRYKKSDLGEESRYDSNAAGTPNDGKRRERKEGLGRKLGKTIAVAVVFGLVAGVVFQGVNRTADAIFPQKKVQTTVTQNANQLASTTSSKGNTTSTDLTALVENTMPSIVSITSTVSQDYSYFGQVYSQEYDGSGSGIIVAQNEKEILIVTNNHVVDGAKAIAVNFINNKVYEAKTKGTDSTADLAVLSVDIKDIDKETLDAIKVATLGTSKDVRVGQMAIAIGNALGSGQSVTVGYISAKNRQINTTGTSQGSQLELLQTDAAINPGNSGGALLNINGEVIGINDMKYADTNVEGMGYAIPISEAVPIINDLMNREILKDSEKGYLGITGNNITKDNNPYDMPIGVYVRDVSSGGAAEEGGIKKGDVITEINGANTKTIESVQEKVNNTRVGTKITVTLMRSEAGEYKKMEVTIKLKDAKSLDSLQKAGNSGKQGNFGYDSNQNQPEDGTQQNPPAPNQEQDGQSQEDINDMLQDFFNQFN
ncbi:MAG: trypsin-like peptidase domain-containing protein [Acetivibrio sp.]